MSSSRRESPLDQPPRRRRRLGSANTSVPDLEDLIYPSTLPTLPMSQNILSSYAGSPSYPGGTPGNNNLSHLAIADLRPSASNPKTTNTSIRAIPLGDILYTRIGSSETTRVLSGNGTGTDRASPGFMTAVERNALAMDERSIGRERLRRHHSPPLSASEIVAPTALILYEIEESAPIQSQQRRPHTPSSRSARYLTLIPSYPRRRTSLSSSAGTSASSTTYTIHPWHKTMLDSQSAALFQAHWIHNKMPVELFANISQHLSRDDIKNMRLVNKEFERGVSRTLFHTVVVPFNTELYDMIEHDKTSKRDPKGKGRAEEFVPRSLQWVNGTDDKEGKVYKGHGLRVFEGFGSHIKNFGMSFEVKEDALCDPPEKKGLDQLQSYFGSYHWPSVEYTRFETLAGLERTADETSQMKVAFSHLEKVKQLALSIDSGLGWMTGPDKSMRSQILQPVLPVVGAGCSYGAADTQRQQRDMFYETLESAYDLFPGSEPELKIGSLHRADLQRAIKDIRGIANTKYSDTRLWPVIDAGVIDLAKQDSNPASESATERPRSGVLYVQANDIESAEHGFANNGEDNIPIVMDDVSPPALIPSSLNKRQKEWLLEADWAQRAFIMSYMLAIVDNKFIFSNITTFKLARISSRLIPLFHRHDFWDALPSLYEVDIGVIPDWLTVGRDEAGRAVTSNIEPSKAHEKAYSLLKEYIGPKRSIKSLKVGWTAGGEHADGCMARNRHVLPAPVTNLAFTLRPPEDDRTILHLPHVEKLTLYNCWISPPTLVKLVKSLEKASLKKITLDSVSLTAHPSSAVHHGNNAGNAVDLPGLAAFNPPLPQAQIVTPPAAQQFADRFWQGPPQGQVADVWALQMLYQLHAIMAHNGILNHQLGAMLSNHPAGITLGQIAQALGMLAVGMPGMFIGGNGQGQMAMPAHAAPGPGILGLPGGFQGVLGNLTFFPIQLGALGAPAPPLPLPPANQQWYENHRDGSWTIVIDAMSPGPNLQMYKPRDEFDPIPEKRATPLEMIELISCGYVYLPEAPFDQSGITVAVNHHLSYHFQRRRAALATSMLRTNDVYLGFIVQYMSEREQDALRFAWDADMGWRDAKLAEVPEHDGCQAGGTGRFNAIITKDRSVGAAVAN